MSFISSLLFFRIFILYIILKIIFQINTVYIVYTVYFIESNYNNLSKNYFINKMESTDREEPSKHFQ